MEDPTYRHPHAIVDVMTDTDVVSVDLSAGEVKAVMRTMKSRMGISYYRDHVTLPVCLARTVRFHSAYRLPSCWWYHTWARSMGGLSKRITTVAAWSSSIQTCSI